MADKTPILTIKRMNSENRPQKGTRVTRVSPQLLSDCSLDRDEQATIAKQATVAKQASADSE
jgi:hypothetical protein